MHIDLNEDLFQDLWPYIIDDKITDIKWNGNGLFIDGPDIAHSRVYETIEVDENGIRKEIKQPKLLEQKFVDIFAGKIANLVNVNFNKSEPSLQAETPELRIQAVHGSVTGDGNTTIAIRKTPGIARLNQQDLVKTGYMSEFVKLLLPCLIRARCSGIITGDVGAGKTELEKYLAQYIPEVDGIVTVEDTLELKLKKLFPSKDIISFKTSDVCNNKMAIKMSLRLNVKWLLIAETRGDDVVDIVEAASTGCCALTTIHAENVWNIPDRVITMAGDKAITGFENSVYNFFDFAIKVKANRDTGKTVRSIDQLCFFDRTDDVNSIIVFIEDGKWTGNKLPIRLIKKFMENIKKDEPNNYERIFKDYYEKQLVMYEEYQNKRQLESQMAK